MGESKAYEIGLSRETWWTERERTREREREREREGIQGGQRKRGVINTCRSGRGKEIKKVEIQYSKSDDKHLKQTNKHKLQEKMTEGEGNEIKTGKRALKSGSVPQVQMNLL